MIRRVDRYLAAEILGPFLSALAFLFMLLMAMQLLRGVDVMLGSGVHAGDLLRIAGFMAPHFLVMAMPVSFLFAAVLAIGRLSEDRETVALAASGVSPARLWGAPVALALLVSGVGVLMALGPEPQGLRALRVYVNELIKRNMAGDVKPGVFYDALTDITLYAQEVSPETRRFAGVMLSDERDPAASMVVLARRGQVDTLGGGASLELIFTDGEIHRAAATGDDYAVVGFDSARLSVGVGGDLLRQNKFKLAREELTPAELRQGAAQARAEGRERDARILDLSLHKRISGPLATVVFALCAVPLALSRRQRSRALGSVVTLAAYVGYYVVGRAAEVAGEAGRLPAPLAAHLANLVFAALAAALAVRAAKAEG